MFVDEHFKPFPDQWAFLATPTAMKAPDMEEAIQRATGDGYPIDVAFASDKDEPETVAARVLIGGTTHQAAERSSALMVRRPCSEPMCPILIMSLIELPLDVPAR